MTCLLGVLLPAAAGCTVNEEAKAPVTRSVLRKTYSWMDPEYGD